ISRFQHVLSDGVTEILAPAFHHYLIASPPRSPSERFDKMQQRVTIAPLEENNSIVGTIVTIEDVTERLEREWSLAKELKSEEEVARLRAAEELAGKENLESVQDLKGVIGDESWRVRKAAVTGLAKHANRDTVSALLRTLR